MVDIFRNGAKLGSADFTATNGTSFTLARGCAVGDLVVMTPNTEVLVGGSYTKAETDTRYAQLAGDQTFTGAQRGAINALTDGATIAPDFSAGNNFSVTLGGNRTLANPTNAVAGQGGVICITQDATGGRTLAFGSNYKFPSGSVPSLSCFLRADVK